MKRLFLALVVTVVALGALPSDAFAQAVREGRILVTVVDQSGAVIPDALVTVIGLEDATKRKEIPAVKTNPKGIATIPGLAIGRYSIQGEFPGFELGLLRDIRVKNGDNKHVMVLPAPEDDRGDHRRPGSRRQPRPIAPARSARR